jgi:radical SAM protein with 4Fe4S-binding SPASM domain
LEGVPRFAFPHPRATKAKAFMGLAAGIEATRACNFRCVHCFVDAGRRPKDELDGREMRTLIKGLVAAGADYIGWSGGEPLLRRDLDELTAYAAGLGAQVGVPTNGYFASRERLKKLKRAGLATIQISLDGADAKRSERYRKGPADTFERVLRALRDAADLGFPTTVCTLLSPETAGEIEEMLALAHSVGASILRYTPFSPYGRAKGSRFDESGWAGAKMRRFLAVAEQHGEGSPVEVMLDCPIGPLPYRSCFSCTAGRAVLYVCATGEVYPCTALMTPEYLVGNVRDRPIGELLRDRRMFLIHRQIVAEAPKGRCARCKLEGCNGGCPGRTLATYGSVRAESPACLYRLHTARK